MPESEPLELSDIQETFNISTKTAQFIVERGEIPEVSEFPKDTPEEDFINILMQVTSCDREMAQEILELERGDLEWDETAKQLVESDD